MIEVKGLFKRFGSAQVLNGVDLSVHDAEIVALLGPSGCGKTTLLRALAGLEKPDAGSISLGGRSVFTDAGRHGIDLPPEARQVGLVFQDFALFPHLDVAANVAFGLRGRDAAVARDRVSLLLKQFDIHGLAKRFPNELSGGQQQRVALARALAPQPRVLLMDEPFSSLDAGLRRRLRVALRVSLKAIGITTVFVTHDQEEALSLADRVAVMDCGRIAQFDQPAIVYREPVDVAVARATGRVNLLDGRAADGVVQCLFGAVGGNGPDGDVIVMVRPEQLRLTSGADGVAATVVGRDYVGPDLELWLQPAGVASTGPVLGDETNEPIIAQALRDEEPPAIGEVVRVRVEGCIRWCSKKSGSQRPR